MNDFIRAVHAYCTTHSSSPGPLLNALERDTHLKTLAPQMLSGPLQGRFLALLSQLMQPRCVLEVGTFTGYATQCLAEGLTPDGVVHTIEGNEELAYLIRAHLAEAKLTEQVQLHIGDALEVLPTLSGPFDLVFLDGNKRQYQACLDLVADKIRPGGLLLADNVLWSGKVVHGATDADTQAMDNFNKNILADVRFEVVLLPLRDGLLLARRKNS